MRISIITAVSNNKGHIADCIKSVVSQNHHDLEYIVIDGGSVDGTMEVINMFTGTGSRITKVVSEPDRGIYDALNKGIKMATGDVIGFLHSDDVYADKTVIEKVVKVMSQNDIDSCYGDLLYVDKNNTERTIRYWKSRPYEKGLFKKGWMPPHPTFFVKRKVYEALGVFNTDFKISADYELMLRFLGKNNISSCYIPEVLVKMRLGGASNKSLRNIIRKSSEDYRAMKLHHVGGLMTLLRKNLSKLPQFVKR